MLYGSRALHIYFCTDAFTMLGLVLRSYFILLSVSVVLCQQHTEDKLVSKLFNSDYNKVARPWYNSSQPVSVDVALHLYSIQDVDERNQELKAFLWIGMYWSDSRLTWNKADYGGISYITVQSSQLWLPDLIILNSPSPTYDILQDDKARASVDHKGEVTYWVSGVIPVSCVMDLTYFPYDEQACYFEMNSWTELSDVLQLKVRGDNGFFIHSVENQQWKVTHASGNATKLKAPSGIEYDSVIFRLHILRKPKYYQMVLGFPCTILSILSLLMFTLPSDSGDKISLGITILLSLTVFQLLIADVTPKTSDTLPLISVYVVALMVLASVSILFATVVIKMIDLDEKKQRMPEFFKFITFSVLARLLCVGWCKKDRKGKEEDGMSMESQKSLNPEEKENGLQKDSTSGNAKSWLQAARVWDRLFFWICFITLIVLFLVVFILAPHLRGEAELTLIDSSKG